MPIPNFLLVHCTYMSTRSNSTGALHSKLKLDEEKLKHAGLAQQNGFAQHFFQGC
jgi:hypothetical protein